jgi:hypothetical protein
MKQIIPFKKDLLFKTKVSEITSISLEHNYKINEDDIAGKFLITGDYKMTDGSIKREVFDFEIPFNITIDDSYKKDTVLVDIDNFYYKIVNNDTLEVNIDIYLDGKKEIEKDIKFEDLVEEINKEEKERKNIEDKDIEFSTPERKEEIMDNKILDSNELESVQNINQKININDNTQKEFNIFSNVDDSETYASYYIYIVKEEDTIDKILDSYKITKEELMPYNELENIKPGDKIIIPSKNE